MSVPRTPSSASARPRSWLRSPGSTLRSRRMRWRATATSSAPCSLCPACPTPRSSRRWRARAATCARRWDGRDERGAIHERAPERSMTLVLAAPLAGWATRLDEVPDPAFAQRLVGDGVAIDPTSSELRAPCDGIIESVHRAGHACTLRAAGGAEILLHIGIDTVDLHGAGFQALVAGGQRVRPGAPWIRFAIGLVWRKAKSLHAPVLLVGGEGLAVIERVEDREVAVGDFLLSIGEVRSRGVGSPTASPAGRGCPPVGSI